MDIEFCADFFDVPMRRANVRYRVTNPSGDGDTINLAPVEYLDDEGARMLYLPTCRHRGIPEEWSSMDRRVYDALVGDGVLRASIYDIEIGIGGYRAPSVSFECEIIGGVDVVKEVINPLRAEDTPDMPLLIWDAVTKEAWNFVNRFVEMGKDIQDASKVEGQ